MLFTPAKLFTVVFVMLFGGGLLQVYHLSAENNSSLKPLGKLAYEKSLLSSSGADWWDNSYNFKRNLSVLNNDTDAIPVDFPIHIHFDNTTTPTASEIYSSSLAIIEGDDVRVIYNNQIELDRFIVRFTPTAIDIWFPLQTELLGGQSDNSSYQLYYGNPLAELPPSTINNVFLPKPDANTVMLSHFQEGSGTTVFDSSGRNHDGTFNGGGWADGYLGIAGVFDGSTSEVNYGNNSDFNLGAMTLEAWVIIPNQTEDYEHIFNKDTYWVRLTASEQIEVRMFMSDSGWSCPNLINTWYHLAVTYNGSNLTRVYVNNVLCSVKDEPRTPNHTSADFRVGNAHNWSGSNYLGQIQHVRISNIERTEFPYGAINIAPSTGVGEAISRPPNLLVLGVVSFDNDLSGWSKDVLESFRVGTAINPDVQVVLLVDRLGKYNTEIVAISNGVITTSQVIPWLQPQHVFELDTADPNTIATFLQWGRQNYPAGRTMVTFIGHGTGPSPALTMPGRAIVPPLPRPYRQRPIDVTNGQYTSTTELGETLNLATNNGADPFDIVFLDQCFGGSIEGLYEIREAAELFIASPNYAWGAFPYDAYLASFVTATTNEDIANAVLTQYQAALDESHPNSIFWTRRTEIETIAAQASTLADALRGEIAQNSDLILQASLASQFADTTLTTGDFTLAPPDELIGLGSFATNLQASFPLTSPVGLAAGDLLTSLQIVQSQTLSQTGSPWSNPNTSWAYTDSFTILAPLTRTLTTNEIWRASIYTDTENLSAHWIVEPANPVPVLINTPLIFTVDHSWDEFISEWYTTELPPSVGLFFPTFPQTLVYTNTQILTVTLEAGVNQISLHWEVPPGLNPADFAIRYQQPDVNEWKLITISPGNKHNYKHWVDFPGTHRFQVIARNNERKAIAFSSPVEIMTEVEQNILLNSESSFNTVRLEWNAPNNPRVFRYQIKRSSLTNPNYALIESNYRENIYFDDSVLENGNLYCYRVEAFSQTDTLLETSNTSCSRWQQVELEIANVRAAAGSTTIVPIRIRNAAGLRTAGSEFWLSYDPQILQVTNVWPTALTESYTTTYQIQSNGVLSQVVISMTPAVTPAVPLFDQGALFWLEVELLNVSSGDAPLFWRPFVNTVGGTQLWALDPTDNPVDVPLELTLGSITIANTYMLGDVDGNGVINILDVKKTLGIAIGRETPPEPDSGLEELQLIAGDLNSNGRIDAADASLILHFIDQGQWPRPGEALHSLQVTTPQTMTVQLDNPTGAQGQLVTVLFSATNLTDFAGGRVVLTYDPGVIDEVIAIEPLGVAQDFEMEAYNGEKGVVVAMASQTPISGNGVVFQLTVRLRSTAPTGDNPLQIGSVQLNDPYGRDLVQSALQHKILRTDGSIHIYSKIFLPTLLR